MCKTKKINRIMYNKIFKLNTLLKKYKPFIKKNMMPAVKKVQKSFLRVLPLGPL